MCMSILQHSGSWTPAFRKYGVELSKCYLLGRVVSSHQRSTSVNCASRECLSGTLRRKVSHICFIIMALCLLALCFIAQALIVSPLSVIGKFASPNVLPVLPPVINNGYMYLSAFFATSSTTTDVVVQQIQLSTLQSNNITVLEVLEGMYDSLFVTAIIPFNNQDRFSDVDNTLLVVWSYYGSVVYTNVTVIDIASKKILNTFGRWQLSDGLFDLDFVDYSRNTAWFEKQLG